MAQPKDNIEIKAPWPWLTQLVLPFCVIFGAVWTLDPQRLVQKNFDIGGFSSNIALDLTNELTHEYKIARGGLVPQCPGESCPLNPVPVSQLMTSRWKAVPSSHYERATADAWRGTYYVRIDTVLPLFAAKPGSNVAFDIMGVAGKSWRMFINGKEKAIGSGGPRENAIEFISDGGTVGDPMVIGFEVDAARSFAPGIISLSQPFLSVPEVAPALRAAYRGIDKEKILPDALGRMVLAVLAALGCLFTPFHLEILVYAAGMALWNYSRLVGNAMAPFPAFLEVDFITLDAAVRCAFYACVMAFFALYFRNRSRVAFIPAAIFAALSPVCFLAGRTGILAPLVPMICQNHFGILGVVLMFGAYFSGRTWLATRSLPHASFRRRLGLFFTLTLGLTALALMARQSAIWGWDLVPIFKTVEIAFRVTKIAELVMAMFGIAIALEWALVVRDRQKVLQRFGMVIDPRVLKEIIQSPNLPTVRAEQVVALFSDLRGFSSICEKFSPAAVNLALNEYLDVVTTAVQKNNGIIDKFVGDAVMALWGVPLRSASDPMDSVRAAIAIRKGMNDLNVRRKARGDFPLACGVGMHCGPAIFGPVGNAQRIDFTAIGPTINLSARLQALTKEKGADILMSQDLHRQVAHKTLCVDLGVTPVRGLSTDAHILRLLGVADASGRINFEDARLAAAGLPTRAGLVEDAPSNMAVVRNLTNPQIAS